MAYRDDATSGEDVLVYVYRWAEKEIASGTINGSNKDFTISYTPANLLGLGNSPIGDYVSGSYFALRDLAVFYRKSGVDTRVDGSAYTVDASLKKITFDSAPSTSIADNIVVSYAYSSADDGVTDYTYYVKDYEVNFGGRDIAEVAVCGGKSYKRVKSQGLVEVSLTTIKKDILLSQILNGDLIYTTDEVPSMNIKSTIGGSTVTPRCLIIKHVDPDNASDMLVTVIRNVRGSECNYSGGADKELEETITVKANPEDVCDMEITSQT